MICKDLKTPKNGKLTQLQYEALLFKRHMKVSIRDDVALCSHFYACYACPLGDCDEPGSSWNQIAQARTKPEAIEADKGMIKALEKILRR